MAKDNTSWINAQKFLTANDARSGEIILAKKQKTRWVVITLKCKKRNICNSHEKIQQKLR